MGVYGEIPYPLSDLNEILPQSSAKTSNDRGFAQTRVLARTGNEAISCTQCRFKATKRKAKAELPIKIEKPRQSEKFLQKRPLHSVYLMKDYPQQYLGFTDCVTMHKEAAQPWMLDSLDELLYANIDLDLTTKKQTKFLGDVRGVIVMPNKFDTGHELQIAVISEEEEDQKQAQELGASTVGDVNFHKQIAQGLFDKEDIRETDFFLCTRKMVQSMNTMRSKLQHKTPSPKDNTISPNVIDLLKHYLEGVMYESKKISQSQATLRIPIGRLNMDTEALEENFKIMYTHLAKLKPSNLTPLVETVTLVCPPCEEKFYVQLDGYFNEATQTKKSDKPAKQEDKSADDEE